MNIPPDLITLLSLLVAALVMARKYSKRKVAIYGE